MIDRGLLATMAVIFTVVAILDRALRGRSTENERILALASTPLLIGIAVGRLAAVALDDRGTLKRPFDLLLIRGGMEFWPAVAAAAVAVWVTTRRGQTSAPARLAVLAPFALWAYATYEAACLVRDGCFGPPFAAGLRPGGIGEPQLPVGVLVGLAGVALGIATWRWSARLGPVRVVCGAVAGLAAVRVAAGFLLPKVTAGLTRPHRESIAVLALSALCVAGLLARPASRSQADRRPPEAGIPAGPAAHELPERDEPAQPGGGA